MAVNTVLNNTAATSRVKDAQIPTLLSEYYTKFNDIDDFDGNPAEVVQIMEWELGADGVAAFLNHTDTSVLPITAEHVEGLVFCARLHHLLLSLTEDVTHQLDRIFVGGKKQLHQFLAGTPFGGMSPQAAMTMASGMMMQNPAMVGQILGPLLGRKDTA